MRIQAVCQERIFVKGRASEPVLSEVEGCRRVLNLTVASALEVKLLAVPVDGHRSRAVRTSFLP